MVFQKYIRKLRNRIHQDNLKEAQTESEETSWTKMLPRVSPLNIQRVTECELTANVRQAGKLIQ